MAKDPYFPLYVQDFLVGTMYFNNKQVGAYIRMLCRQWDTDRLSQEEADNLCHDLTDQEKKGVMVKFKIKRGWLTNSRLESEKLKRSSFCEFQRTRAVEGWKQRKAKQEQIDIEMPTHSHGIGLAMPDSCSSSSSSSSSSDLQKDPQKKLPCEAPEKPEPSRFVAMRILNFLNEKTGKHFRDYEGQKGHRRPTASLEFILYRLQAGATEQDMKGVIVRKCREWLGDPKTAKWLCPATLFNRTNYDKYLGEIACEEVPEREEGEPDPPAALQLFKESR